MKLNQQRLFKTPKAEQHPKVMEEHGNKRVDKYFWLNDPSEENVLNYLKAENEYTEQFMNGFKDLQAEIYNEIIGRIKQDEQTAPYLSNGYYYYNQYKQGSEYPVICRKKESLNAAEEILLDINALSSGHKLYKVDAFAVSPDNSIIAFAVDTMGNNKFNIFFKDLNTGKLLEENLKNTDSSIAWANDSKSFFYTIPDKSMRSYKLMLHILGSFQKNDIEVYHEEDNRFDIWINKSKSRKYIFIISESKLTSEVRYIDADMPKSKPVIIQQRISELIYSVEHIDNSFYILTNFNAINFRLMVTSIENPDIENWSELIPHNKNILLESFEVFRDFIALTERTNGLDYIRIFDLKDRSGYYVDFEEEDYSVFPAENMEMDSEIFRYNYTSLKTPLSTIQFNIRTRQQNVQWQNEIHNYTPENFETKRVFAKSHDGVNIPVSLVYKKGLKKDGSNPLFLLGYGSYALSFNVSFSPDRLSLIERGFIIAIAHIRGGQEMGRQWYEDGKYLKKKNTFMDFISAAEYLVDEKYSSPSKMFANGRSAGGMLMGAVANMKPDLFRGIVAEVPWMDVITDMMNSDLPLTTEEYEEWGNPNDPEYYFYMLSYSPYDNIKHQNYPAMLLTAGLNDSQVPFWSPAKWVAKLRELKTDNNIVLLKTDMETGHSGNSGRFEQYRAAAQKYAFIINQLNNPNA